MAQIFSRQSNWLMRTALVSVPVLIFTLFVIAEAADTSGYVGGQFRSVDQPIPFSHEHHVGQLRIDCRYCHTQVETSARAGIPSTEICMTCHSQVWKDAPMLGPIRESAKTGRAIAWTKVTNLPDFVYFNHSIHIKKGVGCVSCHGQVERMNLTEAQHQMTMEFCLNCHRAPGRHLRPSNLLFAPTDEIAKLPEPELDALERKLMNDDHVSAKTDCTTCHR